MIFLESMTFQNLANAFAGESQARNRYVFFGGIAKKEGFQAIQATFQSTADNEQEHAKVFYKLMNKFSPDKNIIHVKADYPLVMGTTVINLQSAAAGEKEEWEIYADFGGIAEKEGFPDVAVAFRTISTVEHHHYLRYQQLAEAIENKTLFHGANPLDWKCTNCGYVHRGKNAPEICPACVHPQGFFISLPQNY